MTDIIERLAACIAGTVTPEERDAITLEACAEITRLRLTDAEREFLQNLRDAYEELANQTGYVNAAAQADSRKNAATLRGLLERTKRGEK